MYETEKVGAASKREVTTSRKSSKFSIASLYYNFTNSKQQIPT